MKHSYTVYTYFFFFLQNSKIEVESYYYVYDIYSMKYELLSMISFLLCNRMHIHLKNISKNVLLFVIQMYTHMSLLVPRSRRKKTFQQAIYYVIKSVYKNEKKKDIGVSYSSFQIIRTNLSKDQIRKILNKRQIIEMFLNVLLSTVEQFVL